MVGLEAHFIMKMRLTNCDFMNSHRYVISGIVVIFCWSSVWAELRADQPPRGDSNPTPPNIVFVFADDLGWGDLGVFYQNESKHHQVHKTPHLDRLAIGGLQMRAHYCPAPVCAPSRSSLLTGVHQGNAVVRDNQFDKELEDNHTLGTVLQSAGYRTCMIGKYGLQGGPKEKQQDGTPADWPAYPTDRGFDEYFGYVSHFAGHLHYPNDPWELASGKHAGTANLWHSDESGHHEISESLSKCYTTDLFTARAKHFLIEHTAKRNGQPFFLMLNYDTPHAALQVPTQKYPDGGGIDGGLQWTGGDDPSNIMQPAINTASGTVDSFRHPDYINQGWADVDERFATMVRRIDSAVGDLNQTLEELGLAENTLVVFTSDNGPHHESYFAGEIFGGGQYTPQAFQSYGPYDGTKRDCWEGGIRMPTLAWWKGKMEPGRIDSTPSQFHDWMATFCELAGVPAPARCDGVSLIPTLTGVGEQIPSTIYIEYFNKQKTMKYADFLPAHQGRARNQMQVVRLPGDDGVWYKGLRTDIKSANDDFEIYDIENDLEEANNLAGTSLAMQRLQEKMKSHVLQIRHANVSALRPYDLDYVPPSSKKETRVTLRRTPLPKVDYVAAIGAAGFADEKITMSEQGNTVQFTAQKPGIYEVNCVLNVPTDGEYSLTLETHSAAFVRLHGAHAIDVPVAGASDVHAVRRNLAAGNHPVTATIRIEKPATSTRLSLGR